MSDDDERQVLGAMLRDPTCVAIARQIITGRHFHGLDRQLIFETILAVADAGKTADPLTVDAAITADGEHFNGQQVLLHELYAGVITTANVEWHAERVRTAANLRSVQLLGEQLAGVTELDDYNLQHIDDAASTLAAVAQQGDADTDTERQLQFNREVAQQAHRIQVRDAARQRADAARSGSVNLPAITRLDAFLARPLDPVTHRIAGLWPVGGRVLLAAQWKAGKTTLRDNVLRSLIDDEPLLGQYEVTPVDGAVVLLDFELDDATMQRWLEDQGFRHQDRAHVLSMKGYASTFNILEPAMRTRWANMLRAVNPAVLMIDCLRPIVDALGLSEDKDTGRLLVAIDELAQEAGIREVFVVHHMGHAAERSRGDSRLRDWPDAEWKLVRDKDENDPASEDPRGARYLSAFGRDVNHPEAELTYDPDTRHLTIGHDAGNRKQAAEHRKVEQAVDLVLAAVAESPGLGKRALREYIRNTGGDARNEAIDAAARQLITEGQIRVEVHGKSHLHFLANEPLVPLVPDVPDRAPGTASVTVPRAYKGTGTPHPTEGTRANEAGHGHDPTNQQDGAA